MDHGRGSDQKKPTDQKKRENSVSIEKREVDIYIYVRY